MFKEAVSEVGLEPDLLDDCILMASELAASTLHARAVAGTGGGGDRLVSVATDMGGEPIASAGPAPQTPPAGCPDGRRQEWGHADLVEAAEHTVQRYSELGLTVDLTAAEA